MNGRFDRLRFLWWAGAALLLVIAAVAFMGFRLNLSSSFPPGIYRAAPQGPLASVCLTGEAARLAGERGYVRAGVCPGQLAPLMKRVVAQAGDEIELTATGVTVNGRPLANTAPRPHDSKGRLMPALLTTPGGIYRLRLADGQVWIASSYNAGSFDSRYFGPVATTQIRERLEPVWIAFADRSW